VSGIVGSPWSTFVLALAIAAIALVRGRWSGTLVIALLALALVGAIFPPVGFLIAGLVVCSLLAVHGLEVVGHLAQLTGGQQ
jgi:hypothetical protein